MIAPLFWGTGARSEGKLSRSSGSRAREGKGENQSASLAGRGASGFLREQSLVEEIKGDHRGDIKRANYFKGLPLGPDLTEDGWR